MLCRESDPLEESWFGPPLPSADPSFVPPFVQSSGVEKSNLEFLLPATEIRAAAEAAAFAFGGGGGASDKKRRCDAAYSFMSRDATFRR